MKYTFDDWVNFIIFLASAGFTMVGAKMLMGPSAVLIVTGFYLLLLALDIFEIPK